jgi:hypothetical protein
MPAYHPLFNSVHVFQGDPMPPPATRDFYQLSMGLASGHLIGTLKLHGNIGGQATSITQLHLWTASRNEATDFILFDKGSVTFDATVTAETPIGVTSIPFDDGTITGALPTIVRLRILRGSTGEHWYPLTGSSSLYTGATQVLSGITKLNASAQAPNEIVTYCDLSTYQTALGDIRHEWSVTVGVADASEHVTFATSMERWTNASETHSFAGIAASTQPAGICVQPFGIGGYVRLPTTPPGNMAYFHDDRGGSTMTVGFEWIVHTGQHTWPTF